MNSAHRSLVFIMVSVGWTMLGCTVKTATTDPSDADAELGTTEAQLVADDTEANDTDESLESGVDEPLSGASVAEPGAPPDASSDADVLAKVKANAGAFFQPAGCLKTTLVDQVATHVFDNCTGPYGMKSFNGTIVSTWIRAAGAVTVSHEAKSFQINGATVTGKRTVVFTKAGTVVTKTRTGAWSGTTASGKAIEHNANFVTTWDAATKCITRDGTATTSIGARELERTVAGYKRCGIGMRGCPESGEIVLKRTKASGDVSNITLTFAGGQDYRVTLPSGRVVSRKLTCNASAP
jgi:hypothetical protein